MDTQIVIHCMSHFQSHFMLHFCCASAGDRAMKGLRFLQNAWVHLLWPCQRGADATNDRNRNSFLDREWDVSRPCLLCLWWDSRSRSLVSVLTSQRSNWNVPDLTNLTALQLQRCWLTRFENMVIDHDMAGQRATSGDNSKLLSTMAQ